MTEAKTPRWQPGKVTSEALNAEAAQKVAPAVRGRPRQRAVGDERRAIIDAALAVFSERGYPGTTIEDVARRAGVQRRAVYEQFGDKEKLLQSVVDDAVDRTLGRLAKALGASASEERDVEAAFRRNISFALSLGAEDPALGFIVQLALSSGDDEPGRIARAGRRRFESALVFSLQARWKELDLRHFDAAPMVAALVATLCATMSIRLTQEPGWSLDELAILVCQLLHNGVSGIEAQQLTGMAEVRRAASVVAQKSAPRARPKE